MEDDCARLNRIQESANTASAEARRLGLMHTAAELYIRDIRRDGAPRDVVEAAIHVHSLDCGMATLRIEERTRP